MFSDSIDEVVLEQLRQETITAKFLADGLERAYRQALNQFWRNKLIKKVGFFSKKNPVVCKVKFNRGVSEIRLLCVREEPYWLDTEVSVNHKIKSGKFGKTVYHYEVETIFNNIVKQ